MHRLLLETDSEFIHVIGSHVALEMFRRYSATFRDTKVIATFLSHGANSLKSLGPTELNLELCKYSGLIDFFDHVVTDSNEFKKKMVDIFGIDNEFVTICKRSHLSRQKGCLMKICILNALSDHGGASINAFDVAKGMAARGHEIKFVCSGILDRVFTQDGYQVIELGQKKRNPVYHYFNPGLLLKLKKQLTKFQPDIIHIHNINLQSFSLGTLLLSKRYPMLWTLHDLWPLCMTGWPEPADCDGFLAECKNCNQWPNHLASLNKLLKNLVYKLSNFSVTCPSNWMVSAIQNSQLSRKHVSVVHNGIPPSLFFPETITSAQIKLDIPKGKKVILFCGGKRLIGELPARRKGWDYLVESLHILAKKFSNLHLLYVGDRVELQKNFPLPVSFAEGVNREKMYNYYSIADIFVLPTHGDNSPLTILEAMACRTPIVATTVGGIPELIVSGKTGLLCPPRDSKALSESIDCLLSYPEKAFSMAEQGYKRLINNFNFDLMIDRYETCYLDTIAHSREKL